MPLDLIYAIMIVFALFIGYRKGLIVGLFSLVAVIIGLAAAMKLSIVAGIYIGKVIKISDQWLPVISFVVVFFLILLLIRLGARLIEKAFQMVLLGWVNRLGGMLLYMAIFTLVFSVLLFYAEQMKLLKPETISQSVTYSFIQPWGPKVINGFGSLLPVFRDMFGELEKFFDGIARSLSAL